MAIRLCSGSHLEHSGISLELTGTIERFTEPATKDDFLFTRIQLASVAESPIKKEAVIYNFDFGTVRFPYESYDGCGITLR